MAVAPDPATPRGVGWALLVIAVLCVAYAAVVVLTSYSGEYWGVALIVGAVVGAGAWRMLRRGPG
jgi:hypothetical protein